MSTNLLLLEKWKSEMSFQDKVTALKSIIASCFDGNPSLDTQPEISSAVALHNALADFLTANGTHDFHHVEEGLKKGQTLISDTDGHYEWQISDNAGTILINLLQEDMEPIVEDLDIPALLLNHVLVDYVCFSPNSAHFRRRDPAREFVTDTCLAGFKRIDLKPAMRPLNEPSFYVEGNSVGISDTLNGVPIFLLACRDARELQRIANSLTQLAWERVK